MAKRTYYRVNGETIRKFRKHMLMTATELADVFGITMNAVYCWESGLRRPRMDKIEAMVQMAKENKLKIKFKDFVQFED